ncbi:MAG: tetraacyldisaccharide 4'-kinase [Syntrophaceae bacterium]|nr:tetraacyldisaccharide 4'-kinase [Syntrophaceae bacterium]
MKKKEMQRSIEESWAKENIGYRPFELFLRAVSCLYRPVIFLRNRFYDLGFIRQEKLPCKVISVGNITVGGTGKTPMVIYLAYLLQAKGYQPVVLSRGYKGKAKAPINIVSDGKRLLMKPGECGDEPFLIAKSLVGVPVLTGSKRALTGQVAIEQYGADILILDDGFQHRQLARDIDIVLLNTLKPLGNGHFLPAGPLRESSASLKRADLIVRTGSGSEVKSVNHAKPEFHASHKVQSIINAATGKEYPLANMKKNRVCAFSGIAYPEAFRETVEEVGGEVAAFLAFPDHHEYSREDIREIQQTASEVHADMILTTEKDGVKLSRYHMFLEKVHLLSIKMAFSCDGDDFEKLLLEKLGGTFKK